MAGLFFKSGIDKGFERDLSKMNLQLNSFSKNVLRDTKKMDDGFGGIGKTIKELAAIGGFAAISMELKNLTDETYKYRLEISKLTDLQGQQLYDFTADVMASANTFGQETSKMALSVSNFAKGMGVDYNTALQLVNKGFTDGANSSDEFLDQLREYPALLKESGLSAEQTIAIMTQQAKSGIYSDKGIDTIKEGNIRLREMTVATKAALTGIGISGDELQKQLQNGTLTTFQAIQKVSAKLAELPDSSAKVGTALADIFGGPGEDAGIAFIRTLATVQTSLTSTAENVGGVVSQEQELLNVNKELQKAFSNLLGDKNPFTELVIAGKESLIFLIENKDVILSLAAAIVGWKAGQIAMTQVQKLNVAMTYNQIQAQRLTVATGKQVNAANLLMIKSFKALRAAIATNPIGLMISAITILLPLASDLVKSFSKVDEKAKDLADVIKETASSVEKETLSLKVLQTQLQRTEPNSAERVRLIKELNKQYPDLLKNVKGEKVSIDDLNKSFSNYISNLENTIRLKTLQSKLESLIREQQDIESDKDLSGNELYNKLKAIEARKTALNDELIYQKNIVDVSKKYADLIKEQTTLLAQQNDGGSLGETLTNQIQSYDDFAKEYQRINSLTPDGHKISRNITKEELDKAYLQYEQNQQAYISTAENRKKRLLEIEKELNGELTKRETAPVDPAEAKKAQDDANKARLDSLNKSLDIETQIRNNELLKQFAFNESKQDELNQRLLESDLEYLRKKRQITTDALEQLKLDEQIILTRADLSKTVNLETKVVQSDVLKSIDIDGLQKRFEGIKNTELVDNNSLETQKQLFEDITNVVYELQNAFGEVDSELSLILDTAMQVGSGFLGVVDGIKAVEMAATGLEKASAVLAVIAAVMKTINIVTSAIDEANQAQIDKEVTKLQTIHAINLSLIEQNALYKQGNQLLASDSWGTAINGLNTYNLALQKQKETISALSGESNTQAKSMLSNVLDGFKTGLGGVGVIGNLLGGRNERKQLESIKNQAQTYGTVLEQALAGVAVKTKTASKFGRIVGKTDEYDSLLTMYPQLIDSAGELDTTLLKTIVDTQNLSQIDKERLTEIIELTDAANKAYEQFGSYIADIFGNVANDITQAFQTMYESGTDAMTSLEGSMSDMIENFTRDIIEFSLLQPLVNQVNETANTLGQQYAKGDITADELQQNIVSTLGDFYNSLNTIQPEILKAYENADILAAQAGFDSAFAGEAQAVAATGSAVSTIQKSITENTATELTGRVNAILFNTQLMITNSNDMLDLATANLVTLNKIRENTDYLPEIASNTKKTYEKLGNL